MNMQGQNYNFKQPGRNSRITLAVFLLLVGIILLLKAMSFTFFPSWAFTWPVMLIAFGLFIGISRGFRDSSWLFFIAIGGFFLADDIIPGFSFHRFMWPIIIMFVGLMILLRPRNNKKQYKKWRKDWETHTEPWQTGRENTYGSQFVTDDVIDITSVLGGIHKTIVSKNFKGGEIVNFMAGAEINFTQADINGTVTLDITQVMAGMKLIIPPNWQVQNEISSVLGNIDDRRERNAVISQDKVLILKGSSIMAGIDITS
jgi:predicted membrane protein